VVNRRYNESRGFGPLLSPHLRARVEALPGGPWVLPDEQVAGLWKAPVGRALLGTVLLAVGSPIALVVSVVQLRFLGVLTALGGLLLAAALWRVTIYGVQNYFAALEELDP
jgi:hypothetical protein